MVFLYTVAEWFTSNDGDSLIPVLKDLFPNFWVSLFNVPQALVELAQFSESEFSDTAANRIHRFLFECMMETADPSSIGEIASLGELSQMDK